jgi:molybdopterin synthase sulfur carrier subunit
MAVEVRIPTILRTYTGGEKAVTGEGSTLSELIENLEASHPGIKDRLIEANGADGSGDLRRFVNVYVNDEDVRFTGGLGTSVSDGDQVVVLPAVAGGSGSPLVEPSRVVEPVETTLLAGRPRVVEPSRVVEPVETTA